MKFEKIRLLDFLFFRIKNDICKQYKTIYCFMDSDNYFELALRKENEIFGKNEFDYLEKIIITDTIRENILHKNIEWLENIYKKHLNLNRLKEIDCDFN